MMRKTMKILHTVGSCGMLGAVVAAMILLALPMGQGIDSYVQTRVAVAALSDYILLPSLGAVIFSGLIAMAVHMPYLQKGWVLVKAAFGIIVFKGTLHLVGAHGAYADVLTAEQAAGRLGWEDATGALPHEWALLWTMLALGVANIVLGVWRPNFERAKQKRATRLTVAEAPSETRRAA